MNYINTNIMLLLLLSLIIPTPFGKQDVLPSLYYRGINGINTESKKKNHGDDDDDDGESSGMIQAIQFDGTKHGNLVNQVDVMGFIKSFL